MSYCYSIYFYVFANEANLRNRTKKKKTGELKMDRKYPDTFLGKRINIIHHLNWDNNDIGIQILNRRKIVIPFWFLPPLLFVMRITDALWKTRNDINNYRELFEWRSKNDQN